MTCKYIPLNEDSFEKTGRDFSDVIKMNVAKGKLFQASWQTTFPVFCSSSSLSGRKILTQDVFDAFYKSLFLYLSVSSS